MTPSLILWSVAGLLCGLAEAFYWRRTDKAAVALDCLLGIAGAVGAGYALSGTFGLFTSGWIGPLTAAVTGAAIVISIAGLVRRQQHTLTASQKDL